jgi:hypothetical protein
MFNWIDDIHFVALQLNHYCGHAWSYRLCSDFVGCSSSSVSKYLKQNWNLTEEQSKILKKIIKTLNYDNYEIKLLTPQKERYFLDATKTQVIKKPFPKNTPVEEKRIVKEFTTKYSFNNKVQIKWTDKGGVYMLAQIVSPPTRPGERYYLIKVGKSQSLNKRISAYKGMNPFALCIDIEIFSSRFIDDAETRYHNLLDSKYQRQNGTEWFVVPVEDYEVFLNYGFDAFKNKKI